MKIVRLMCLLLAVLMVAGMVSACGKKSQEETQAENDYCFEAWVLTVSNRGVMVGPVEDGVEMAAAGDSGILLNIEMLNGVSLDSLKPGMLIRVTYDGKITYSYPAQINGIINVEILDEVK